MPKILDDGVLLSFDEYAEYLEAKAVIRELQDLKPAKPDFIQALEQDSTIIKEGA